ncbi:MAG: hypothetical protein H3C34_10160 [Caldilineaceae bacterium]|nr:hypothetical protein [Caldilineaceae bacterium]
MLVREAKEVARRWVLENSSTLPGFRGAFFHGSITYLRDDAIISPTSDVDVMVVFSDPPPHKVGKLVYDGVLLEISYLPSEQLKSPEQVLGTYRLAGSFRSPGIIADPSGQLTSLQQEVARQFAQHRWVYKRCEDARSNILRFIHSLDASAPLHEQVMAWLFAAGGTTHPLLVAGLKNPTVRKRFLDARALLAGYGRLDFYEQLLELLGCSHMEQEQAEGHLNQLAAVFDVAQSVVKTPFFFKSDISELARPIAIDGSRELIRRGDWREAVFWMAVTYSRCMAVLRHDGSAEMQEKFLPGYRHLLGDLGIVTFNDLQQRSQQLEAFLPSLWEVTEAILAANPEVVH